jgi:hypothetical protein
MKINARVDVLTRTRRQVIDSDDSIALLEQLFGQITAYKARHTGHHDALLHVSTLLSNAETRIKGNIGVRHITRELTYSDGVMEHLD